MHGGKGLRAHPLQHYAETQKPGDRHLQGAAAVHHRRPRRWWTLPANASSPGSPSDNPGWAGRSSVAISA